MRLALGARLTAIGFSFEETLSGAFYPREAPHRHAPVVVTLRATAPSLRAFVSTWSLSVDGTIEAPQIASRARVAGSIVHARSGGRPLASYRLAFTDDRGEPVTLLLVKRLVPRHPYASWTVLTGSFRDAGDARLAECVVRFDARTDLAAYLRSFQLRPPDLARD